MEATPVKTPTLHESQYNAKLTPVSRAGVVRRIVGKQEIFMGNSSILRIYDNSGRVMQLSADEQGYGFVVDTGGSDFGDFRYLELTSIESPSGKAITVQIGGLELLWQISNSGNGSTLPSKNASNRPIPNDVSTIEYGAPYPKQVVRRKNRMHLWVKVPNFLLPLHIRSNDRNHRNDGHFSWLGMTIWATSEGLYLGRLSFAAGSDTRDLFWFKSVKDWRGFLIRRPLLLENTLTFKTRPNSAAIGFVQPRFRLEAACETILGLSPLDGLRSIEYLDGREFYARWVETDSVYRLEFTRAFVTSDSTRVVGVESGVIVRLQQTGGEPKKTTLMQPWKLQATVDGTEPVRGWWNHLIFGGNPTGIQRSFAFELAAVKADKGAPESFTFELLPEQERGTSAWSFSLRPHLKAWDEYRRLKLRFPYLLDSAGHPLEVVAEVKCEIKRREDQEEGVTLRVKPVNPLSAATNPASVTRVVRFGSLDILFGGSLPGNGTNDTGSDEFKVHVLVGSQGQAPGPGAIANWSVRSFQIGGAEVATDPRALPQESLMRLPVFSAYPGGVETSSRANELESSRAGLIMRLNQPSPDLKEPLLWLAVAERKDSNGASGLEIRILRRKAAAPSPLAASAEENLFYFSWRPFLAVLIRTNRLENFDLQRGAGELAYWSSQGVFEGWQGRAAAEKSELVFPPQAMGEEMERIKEGAGEEDINEGELVDFRLSPPSILTLRTNDVARNYAAMPWNVAGLLDDLRSNRLAGASVESANIELVYGFAMKLSGLRGIRLGEIFARAGWPRRTLPGWDPKRPGSTAAEIYNAVRKDWDGLLESYQSRLAIYELFDEQAVDFSEGGEPAGTVLFGKAPDASVTGYLRKKAHIANSLNSRYPQPEKPIDPLGLRGSFAWAFESKILFEALWLDLNPSTPDYVEATESTLARVFFSARGGWGSQEGKFDNGRTIIAAHVEMGRISEMRLERIGRLGVYWNKAKHVIVYRRSTLPTGQFEQSQDLHRGRPILRKAEEYVEFLENVRRFPDKQTAAQHHALPGCLCACSCHERFHVDSAWGSDVYYDGKAIGWKVPLYKTGARQDVYQEGNVHLHFRGNPASDTKELKCRVKNLQDLWFWTEARPEYTSNTEEWPAVPDVDLGRFTECKEPAPAELRATVGSPPIPQGAGAFTWEIEPPVREANLVSHLPADSGSQPQIGSILRTVTVSRGAILAAALDDTGAGAAIREQVDNALFKLDQIKHTLGELSRTDLPAARGTIEAIFGELRNAGPVIQRAGAPYIDFAKHLDEVADALVRHRLKQNVDWTMTRLKSRLEAEVHQRMSLVGNSERYQDLKRAATNTEGVLALANFHIAQTRATIQDLPDSLDFFLARLRGVAKQLSKEGLAEIARIADELVRKIGAGADFTNEKQQLEKFIGYLLTAERDLQDIHWWRGLTLKLKWDDVVVDLRKALELVRSANQGVPGLDQIKTFLLGLEIKAAEIVKQFKKVADQLPATATDLLKSELEALTGATILADFEKQVAAINSKIEAALETQARATADLMASLPELQNLFKTPKEFYDDLMGVLVGKTGDLSELLKKLDQGSANIIGEVDVFLKKARDATRLAVDAVDRLIPKTEKELKELLAVAGSATGAVNELGKYAGALDSKFKGMEEALKKDVGMRLHRAFGDVPRVTGLDFQKIAGEIGTTKIDALLRGAIRTVGFNFPDAADIARNRKEWKVAMTEVESLVDRQRQLVGGAVEAAKLKASSLVTPVKELADRLKPNIDEARARLEKLIPDFGGLKLEKLLGNIPISGDLAEKIKRVVKVQHGFDRQAMSAFVDSKVDNLSLGRDLTLFNFGPFACRLRKPDLFAHLRIETLQDGTVRRQEEGRITANWEMVFQGEPLVTFRGATLESLNGRVKMNLDPNRLEMSKVLKAISDLCSVYNGSSDGFVTGIETKFPDSVEAFCRMNIELPPVGGGAFSITNLWMAGHFELLVTKKAFEIRCGLNIASAEKPFAIVIFILGGCGWFRLDTRYHIPFEGGSELEVELDVGIGASAGLAINLGFLRGSVVISFAVNLTATVQRCPLPQGNKSHLSFSFVLTFNGHVSVLGIISVDLMIMLAIRYETGGGMVGEGRVSLRIKICWCFTLKVNRSFTYRFGKSKSQSSAFHEHELNPARPERAYANRIEDRRNLEQLFASVRRAEECVC